MFENIGEKIKNLAKIICYFGITISLITAFVLLVIAEESYEPGPLVLGAFLVGILGFIFSWTGSFFMYGFGELIDNSRKIKEELIKCSNTKNLNSKQSSNHTIKNLKINKVATDTHVATCSLCGREFVVVRECEINDGFSTTNKKLCENCIIENGGNLNANNKFPVTPAFINNSIVTSTEVISSPKKEDTKMCLECGRIIPIWQKECVCGKIQENIDDINENYVETTQTKKCKYCGKVVSSSIERCGCGCLVFEEIF